MTTAKVFRSGRSQAVRLPKEYRFDTDEVIINKIDDMVVMFPRKKGWEILTRSLDRFTDDFLADRDQPTENQKRKPL